MIKKRGFFQIKKTRLIAIFTIVAIAGTVIFIKYDQQQSDKKEQMVILQQKENDQKTEKLEKEKMATEIQQKKLKQEKALKEKKALEDKKAMLESKALEEQKILEKQKVLKEQKALQEQKKTNEEKVKKEANADNLLNKKPKENGFTKENAIEIVSKIIINKTPKVKVEYDHNQKREGKNYYVVRAYDDMADHISTLGWYYVQVDTGKAFEWNLMEDTLTPIN